MLIKNENLEIQKFRSLRFNERNGIQLCVIKRKEKERNKEEKEKEK